MFIPVMLGFVYTKTPSWSAIASATTGLLLVLACNVVFDFSAHQYEANIFVGVFSSALVFFLASFFPERNVQARERIVAFARDLATPAMTEGQRLDFNTMHSYKVVGVLTVGVGAGLLLLMLVPTSSAVWMINFVAGLGTLVVGVMMVWYFKKKVKEAKHHKDSLQKISKF
jgi:hypothetical protein